MNDSVFPRPWLRHYSPDCPAEIPELRYQNLGEYIEDICSRYAEYPAFSNFGTTKTYAEIAVRARAFAAWLTQKGLVQKGTRLAIMMPNLLQFPICFYGGIWAGAEIVNVNPLYTARELHHQLQDSGAEILVIAENFTQVLAKVRDKLPQLRTIITTTFGDELGAIKGAAFNFVVRHLKKISKVAPIAGAIPYQKVLAAGKKYPFVPAPRCRDDRAVLQYTGGTTGTAKGAMLSHGNILANIAQVELWIGGVVKQPGMVLITALPLYHIFCCTVNCLMLPGKGMHSVLITNPRDLKSFVKTLARYPFAVLTGVNTLFKGLLNTPGFAALDFGHLQFVISGGMPLEKAISERWQQLTGNVIVEGYGLTETSPIVCVNRLHNPHYTNGIGYPIPSTDVSLRDEDGAEVPYGCAGEMWVRGPQVMQGYWQQPEENRLVFAEGGWLRTGDIAEMDERGFIRIIDRKKDMILVSGFNVYPSEVEGVLQSHPAVLEAGVCAVPSPESGEAVKAYVVVHSGHSVSEDELRDFVRGRLTGYKRPRFYCFCESLPKSNVGKILRRELRRLDDPQDA